MASFMVLVIPCASSVNYCEVIRGLLGVLWSDYDGGWGPEMLLEPVTKCSA